MTRDEQIIEASHNYGKTLNKEAAFDYEDMKCAFQEGAMWADEYLNLESLWHDASEEPKGDKWHIAYIDVFGSIHSLKCPSVTFDTFPSLAEFAAGVGMQYWAYVSDLLPKGGKK